MSINLPSKEIVFLLEIMFRSEPCILEPRMPFYLHTVLFSVVEGF